MIVDRNSWHMKLGQLGESRGNIYQPSNLCIHFWTVVAGMFLLVIAGTLMIALAIIVGPPYLAYQEIERIRPHKTKREKAPGLVLSWLKAKKQRVCPLIEVRD